MNGLQFLVLKDYVVVLAFFVCFDLILPLYGLTRNGIDVAGVDTIAGFSIDRVKTHLLPLGRRGGEGDGARHEGELQISLPEWSNSHGPLLRLRAKRIVKVCVPQFAMVSERFGNRLSWKWQKRAPYSLKWFPNSASDLDVAGVTCPSASGPERVAVFT